MFDSLLSLILESLMSCKRWVLSHDRNPASLSTPSQFFIVMKQEAEMYGGYKMQSYRWQSGWYVEFVSSLWRIETVCYFWRFSCSLQSTLKRVKLLEWSKLAYSTDGKWRIAQDDLGNINWRNVQGTSDDSISLHGAFQITVNGNCTGCFKWL